MSVRTLPRISPLLGFAAIALATAAHPVIAQPEPINGMRPSDVRRDAIVGATVIPEPGVRLERATIVLRDGTIEAVGADVAVPPAARIWPGDGLTVYAGLIDPAVFVDTESLPAAPGRHWNDHVHPELAMSDQPPLAADVGKELRGLGFTAAAVYPSTGIFRGSGTVIALADDAVHRRTYVDHGPMAMSLERVGSWTNPRTPGSLMGVIAVIRQTFKDAQWHQECRATYARHPGGNEPPIPALALVALDDVIERRRPVLFDVTSEQNLLRAARLAREFELECIMLGSGREFARLDEIAALGMPIIVPLQFPKAPDVSTLHRSDSVSLRAMTIWEQAPTNPRRLVDAGVPMAFTTHRLKKRKTFPEAIRSAIRHGLSEDDALNALTVGPAALLGLDGVMGTIEPGKLANLVVVDGSLFEKDAEIRATWINGRRIEVNPAPYAPLEMEAQLVTDDGRRVRVDLDTGAPSATFRLGDEKIKAKKLIVLKDQISMVVDAVVLGTRGHAQLTGVRTKDGITGTAQMPDGTRVPFTITRVDDAVAAAGGDGDDSAVAGTWIFDVTDVDAGSTVTMSVDLSVDVDGAVTGTGTIDDAPVDVTGGSYDADSKLLELTCQDPEGRTVTLSGAAEGPSFDGDGSRDGAALVFTARRENGDGDGDDDFEMPPDTLALPLGAFALSQMPPEQDVLIENATIWTSGPDGILANADMLVRGGRIAAIGESVGAIDDVVRIDARGKHVTPGLMDCHSHTGISGGVNEFPEANTAEVRIADVVNPDDINWYRQLAGGLTAANLLHGSANPIGGQNCVVKLKWGGSADDFPIEGAIGGIKFALGENVKRREGRYPDTRMGVETFIRDAFNAARTYLRERARYDALSPSEQRRVMPPRPDLELEALVDILEGRRLIHCHSYRQDEILMLIRVAEEFDFTIGTFQHVLEGYKVADAIALHGAGASSFSDWWAYKVEVQDAIPFNGALMHDVGVLVTFNSDSSELARRMNGEAAKAVRYGGVDPHEALGFVTINVARQLRVDHRTGSLEVGKDADFAIWSGDPLSTYSICEQTWIEGRRYFDLEDDRAKRAAVASERRRLIQKLLAKAHGEPRSADDDEAHASHDAGAFEDLDEETIAWLEEQVRLGRDPLEVRPGDCGCGTLWNICQEQH